MFARCNRMVEGDITNLEDCLKACKDNNIKKLKVKGLF